MKKYQTFLLIISMIAAGSCSVRHTTNVETHSSSTVNLDSLRKIWREHNVLGEYDSVIIKTMPYYVQADLSGDTITLLYTGTFIAQSYLFKEDIDSVNYYLAHLSSYEKKCKDPEIRAIYNIVNGCYILKTELDYSKALSAFYEGLNWAEEAHDINNQIVLLANISNIFYTRSDKYGLKYASKAYKLAKLPDVDNFPRCQAQITMAQMLWLSGDYPAMLSILQQTDRILDSCRYYSLMSHTDIIYATYFWKTGNKELADSSFKQAIRFSSLVEPSIASYIHMQYGDFFIDNNDPYNAIKKYLQGLEISYKSNNSEFRSDLLQKLSKTYSDIGDIANAALYAEDLRKFKDSLTTYKKELDFNNLRLAYQQMEHEHEMQKKELDLIKANRNTLIFFYIVLLIVIIASFIYILFLRQRKMYRTLVRQHQSFLQQLQSETSENKIDTNEGNADENQCDENNPDINNNKQNLYHKLEELMRTSKLYRQKNLSLDKIAELLGTNRTYVSRSINMFAGLTFYGYLDRYRIREATEILSDINLDIPFKQMADDLGYNSVSVFYKAFRKETGCTPKYYKDEVRRIQTSSTIENP